MTTQPLLFAAPPAPLDGYDASEARALAIQATEGHRFRWVESMRWRSDAWRSDAQSEAACMLHGWEADDAHEATSGVIMGSAGPGHEAYPDLNDGPTLRILERLAGCEEGVSVAELVDALELTELVEQPAIRRMDAIRREYDAFWRARRGTARGIRPFCDVAGYGFLETYRAIRGRP